MFFFFYRSFPSHGDIGFVLLLLRSRSEDIGFLMIDPAETDIAIGPVRANRK